MSQIVVKKAFLLAGSATFLVLGLKLLKKAAVIVIRDSVDKFIAETEPYPYRRMNKREYTIRRPYNYYSRSNDRARRNIMES